jgi:putative ABC transport system permease protein
MINYQENFSMAFETILAHKFRSFLTVLGIIVGVLTVIVIASVLTGMRKSIVTQVEKYGTNNIFAFHLNTGPRIGSGRRPREEWLRKPLTIQDAAAIKEMCPSVQDISWQGVTLYLRIQISYKENKLRNLNFLPTPANYATVANVTVANGRFFTEVEDEHRMSVTVLGPDAANALFPNTDPIGKQMLLNGRPFTIIGVTEKSKSSLINVGDGDNSVYIPYQTFKKLSPWENWHVLFIQARSGQRNKALDEVESVLRRRRGVKPSEPNNFDLTTADRFIQQFDAITASVGLVAIAISSVGLLVGGIGVMNIMLVSVTERTREIGVRKAIGATRKDIVLQFLFEAMTLTGVGGVLGIILAVAISFLLFIIIPALPAAIPMWAVITGLTVSIAVGLIFGVWPARKAAKLDPIEALRYE